METLKISLSDLEIFFSVAKYLSISRAAKELQFSKSYVSKRISELEKQIGGELFVRTTRSFQLTQMAEKIKEKFGQPMTELSAAARTMSKSALSSGHDRATVSATYDVCLFPLARALQKISASHKCIVEVLAQDKPIDFFNNDLTAAIRINRIVDDRLIAKVLVEMPVVWACHPRIAKNANSPIALPSAFILEKIVSTNLNALRHRVIFSSNTPLQLREFIRLGLGCAPIPRFMLADLIQSGEAQELEKFPSFKSIPFYFVHRRKIHLSPHLRAFVDQIYGALLQEFKYSLN